MCHDIRNNQTESWRLLHGHRKTTTLVAGLRLDGMVAPMVLNGSINGDRFEAYVSQILIPDLKAGDIVIMDDLSSHKCPAVQPRSKQPVPNCAFFRPTAQISIENAFAKLKALLRKAAERTVERHRQSHRRLHSSRLRQLLRRRRVRCRLIGHCSNVQSDNAAR